MPSLLTEFTRGFHPDARARLTMTELLAHKGPKALIDGWPWYTLSEADLAHMRTTDYLAADFNTLTGESGLEFRNGGQRDVRVLPVPSRLDDPLRPRPHNLPYAGHAWITLFPGLVTPVGTILANLRPRDAIRLLWWEDAETNEPLRRAGLHADLLRLEVRRPGLPGQLDGVLVYDLAQSIGEDGPGRLIQPFDPAAVR